jgi:3-isopropylmalate/(R)-2-methylmalate dehydratase small subunit
LRFLKKESGIMNKIIRGKAFVLGDNIDTDQIIPAGWLKLSTTDPEERKLYGKYAMSGVPQGQTGLPQGNIPYVKEGTYRSDFAIVIGGKNFGCGSSREHAPLAIAEAGSTCVVAEFYARIFFRNCVNGGYLVPFETDLRLVDKIKTGDELEIDMAKSTLKNLTDGKTYQLKPLGDVAPIIEAGGVFDYAKQTGMLAK